MSKTGPFRPTLAELDALRDALLRAGGAALELELGDMRLRMVPARTPMANRSASAHGTPTAAPARTIDSEGPGLLRLFDPAGGPQLVAPGDTVEADQIVALLEVGTALLPVCARAAGRIEAILAEDGDIVGYGTPLFRLAD